MRRALLLLPALALVAASLVGCSEQSTWHWRKTAFDNFYVHVAIPSINPYELDNNTPEFVAAVDQAVASWNAHPDVRVVRINGGCPYDVNEWNCVLAWRVPPSVEANAFALVWANDEHAFTNNMQTTPDFSRIVFNDTWEQDTALINNATCHELGHALGLQHFDSDNDGQPDAEGPCVDAVPDQVDLDNIEAMYDTCHRDPMPGPTGVPASADGGEGDSCPAGATASTLADGSGDPGLLTPRVHADTRAEIEALYTP